MPEPLSETEFAVFIKRAGVPCPPEDIPEVYEAYGYVAAMAESLRRPRSHMAEPAHTFAHPQETKA